MKTYGDARGVGPWYPRVVPESPGHGARESGPNRATPEGPGQVEQPFVVTVLLHPGIACVTSSQLAWYTLLGSLYHNRPLRGRIVHRNQSGQSPTQLSEEKRDQERNAPREIVVGNSKPRRRTPRVDPRTQEGFDSDVCSGFIVSARVC